MYRTAVLVVVIASSLVAGEQTGSVKCVIALMVRTTRLEKQGTFMDNAVRGVFR
ncbi:MAG: hypothetical protein J7K88_04770 [Candidatus Fermentibacteraceae bacterium]|nr:hypothetical protein [Candidatus Fermentibacteraceae bacterium]